MFITFFCLYISIKLWIIYFLGIQIPQDIFSIEHFESKAKYILIIEKNASFQKIINEGFLIKNKCSFILITVSEYTHIILVKSLHLY